MLADQRSIFERASKLSLCQPAPLRGRVPVGFLTICLHFHHVSRFTGHNSSSRWHSFHKQSRCGTVSGE